MAIVSNPLLAGLNPDQQEAVCYHDGPLLILAGPGSGKTRVITHRIAYTVLERRIPARRVLAITFTNRAASELRARLLALLGGEHEVHAGTFHWACNALLRRHIHHLGYRRTYRILSPSEARAVLRAALLSVQGHDATQLRTFSAAVSAHKNGLPLADAARRHGIPTDALYVILDGYARRLSAAGALDIDDLQRTAVELLRQHDTVRRRAQIAFDDILIDEYQDTNSVQAELLTLLRPAGTPLTAVGDEDQSIYGWRQAGAGSTAEFLDLFPSARTVTLHDTYRCHKRILRAASSLIAHNRQRVAKELRSVRPAGQTPVCYAAADERDEADWIAREILRLQQHLALSWSQFGVLFRVNAQARALEDAFVQHGIPCHAPAGFRFYDRPEVRAALAYLRLTLDPDDDGAMAHLLTCVPGLADRRIAALREAAGTSPLTAYLAGDDLPLPSALSARVAALTAQHRLLVAARTVPLASLLDLAINAVRSALPELIRDTIVGGDALDELRTVVHEVSTRRLTLRSFVDRLSLLPAERDQANSVALLSLHAAKGLEFRVVVLAGVEEGLLPHRRSLTSDADLAEERRLCYVGMTRAEDHLYLTYAHARMLGGSVLSGGPSRFIAEIGTRNMTLQTSPHLQNRPRLVSIQVGERVRHPRWDIGTVVAVDGHGRDTVVTIDFSSVGRQRLQLHHAPLGRLAKEQRHDRAG
jgi:DNA helicase-2/ATP-dependent DNA helicase PcrA